MAERKVVLAFSGGLDTSFCLVWLREEKAAEVVPVTVDTGGFSATERKAIEKRARELGAPGLHWIDGRKKLFGRFLTYLIFGNCLKGGVYPYSVSAERTLQAEEVVAVARRVGATAVAHGSTGAGNDQVRFDGVIRVVAPALEILTPVRDLMISRDEEIRYLRKKGYSVSPARQAFSINRGLWGTTYGNRDLQDVRSGKAFDALYSKNHTARGRKNFALEFEHGVPVCFNGRRMEGYALVETLNRVGAPWKIGFGLHTGTTALGIKGRIAFHAPAAWLLIRAHQELEKTVLTRDELFWKGILGEVYGDFLHRGLYLHPLLREIEAFLKTSQEHVTGKVSGFLASGEAFVTAVDSPFSLFDAGKATYGEGAPWSPEEVKGFIRFHHLETTLSSTRGGGRS